MDRCKLTPMPASSGHPTIAAALRQALGEAPSLYAVAKATGVQKTSLIRFLRGEQSLRLDMADRLAAYFWRPVVHRYRIQAFVRRDGSVYRAVTQVVRVDP